MATKTRRGAANSFYLWGLASLVAVIVLSYLLFAASRSPSVDDSSSSEKPNVNASNDSGANSDELFMYCAAGMRYPMEQIVADYQQEYGVAVQLQYGGSNTLLNQLEVSKTGDLYLAGDDSYIKLAREKDLAEEVLPLAAMRPVIVVRKGNPKKINTIEDLKREDVVTALGEPTAAAVGKKTKRLLSASGDWNDVNHRVTASGVFKDTVNAVANDVKLRSVDAGIVWDSTVAQYPELEAVVAPELNAGLAHIEVTVLRSSKRPVAALRFARYLAARDKGLKIFERKGFETVQGDVWAEAPELNFYAGAVNRKALAPIIQRFEKREGVKINTVYNGCGTLTGQMEMIKKNQDSGFPDTYMACDVYYLETVKDWFQEAVNVSDTDIVIVTQKGNPKKLRALEDLAQPGVRVAIGQPEKCTIGVLSRRLLQSEGLYDKVIKQNVEMQSPSSAFLIPNVVAGHVDAVLAYRSDTEAEKSRLEVVSIDSPLAKAVQPFSISRSSDFKYLSRRLFNTISKSRNVFESAGFHWRLDHQNEAPPDAGE